jgi:hypothetical protein
MLGYNQHEVKELLRGYLSIHRFIYFYYLEILVITKEVTCRLMPATLWVQPSVIPILPIRQPLMVLQDRFMASRTKKS